MVAVAGAESKLVMLQRQDGLPCRIRIDVGTVSGNRYLGGVDGIGIFPALVYEVVIRIPPVQQVSAADRIAFPVNDLCVNVISGIIVFVV